MRKLAALLVLICFCSMPATGKSMQMFSIEKGSVYTENFSLNHLLVSEYIGFCGSCSQEFNSLAPFRNYNHSHVVLLNTIAGEYSDEIGQDRSIIQITFLPNSAHDLLGACQFNSARSLTRLKFLPPPRLPFQNFTVLLI